MSWLVEIAREAEWVGIDSPFGWPEATLDALSTWASGGRWPDADKDDLRYRLTDRFVRDETGRSPLSVSSDRIAVTAWRCARLLDALRPDGRPVDRTGADGIFEVYAGAALTCWDFNRVGYKTSGNAKSKEQREARIALMAEISRRAPWLDLAAARDHCVRSDDALDALIAALVARAAGLELTLGPPAGDTTKGRRVAREGWIHLPQKTALDGLVRPS